MKLGNAKIHERSNNNEAVRIQKRNNKYLFYLMVAMLSYGIYDMFFKYNTAVISLFVNPFKSDFYLKNNYHLILTMLIITVLIYLFHFGSMKRKYIQKLEKAKQKILDFFPIYCTGSDERNLYFRFGLKESLKKNFVERNIHKQDYLKKVSFLSVFVEEYSPHKLFSYKNKTLKISEYFNDEKDYLELFRIIEGYLIDNKNIDIFQNDLPLSKFKAIGSYSPRYTKESIKYFLNNCSKEKLYKKFENIFDDKNLSKDKRNAKIKKLIISEMGERGFIDYKTDVSKMVVFSSRALYEFLEKIHNDSKAYLTKIKLFKTKAYEDMLSFGEIDEDKILDLIVFCHFFKIINLFMGLPSGIVTARISDYHFSRILDDLEHFEDSIGIREIKKKINDYNSKFDDTFPRSFMVFYHDYYRNSKNREVLTDILTSFNPLVSLDVSDRINHIPTSFGVYDPNDNYTPKEYVLPDVETDVETLKKQKGDIQ